jgi:hypothetical protein
LNAFAEKQARRGNRVNKNIMLKRRTCRKPGECNSATLEPKKTWPSLNGQFIWWADHGSIEGPQIFHRRFKNNPLLVASFNPSKIKSSPSLVSIEHADVHSQIQTNLKTKVPRIDSCCRQCSSENT